MDYLHYIIGTGQLALLLGIFKKMGALQQAATDHAVSDDNKFKAIDRRVDTLETRRSQHV